MDLINDDPPEDDQNPQENTKELEIENLIAELCLNTSSDPVKFCLRKYKYGKSVQDIENNIFKEKHDTLKAGLQIRILSLLVMKL